MSEEKFTKGEWKASDVRINGEHIKNSWKVSIGGFLLADVTSGATFGVVDEIQKANAHLIAAAPEMYEILKSLNEINVPAEYLEASELDALYSIEKILAKARGEKC